MGKPLFIMILAATFAASSCTGLYAQEKKNLIKVSLVMPLASTFGLSYEVMLNDDMSLHFGGGVGKLNYFNPQFRYYLNENKVAPSGAFIAPFLMIKEDPGGGLAVGYQQLFKQKVSLEAYAGPLVASEIGIWGGINVGLAF